MRGGERLPGHLVWLLLVACTVAGTASMHAFGHQALRHTHEQQAHDHAGHGGHADHAIHAGQAGHAEPVSARNGGETDHEHLLDLCVAVLGGMLLLLLARGRARRALLLVLPRRAAVPAPVSRGPPPVPFGLTLATVAVLRT